MPDVTRTIEIKATPEEVWRYVEDQQSLRLWLSPSLEIDLRVGGRYRLLAPDDSTAITGTVLEFVPAQLLVLTWLEEDAGWTSPARLSITLTPTESGTEVSLVHDGFDGIGSPRSAEIAQAYERGADHHQLLERLAELVISDGAR